jgi:hypothetical protein
LREAAEICGNGWTGARVLERLGAAFIAAPGLAVYSSTPNHFEHIDGPIDGSQMIAAAAIVLGHGSDAYVWLLARARAEAGGLDVTELCQAKHWPRSTFYERTRTAAGRVALYLNEHR